MRVLLVGSPPDRARLRAQLVAAAVEIAAEFSTLAAARASDVEHDAIVIADGDARPELVEGGTLRASRTSSDEETLWEPLTPREVQVLELLAEGLPNKAIASRLDISDQTVKFHVSAICGKLGAANRTDAVRRAVRRGLITL
jgi:ATP/maltotriose-dependent transcriptional regulator MalT